MLCTRLAGTNDGALTRLLPVLTYASRPGGWSGRPRALPTG